MARPVRVADRPRDHARRGTAKAVAAKLAGMAAGNDMRRHRGAAATSDRLYDDDEAEWLAAVERWKAATGTRFPTLCELLAVARSLGYRKADPKE